MNMGICIGINDAYFQSCFIGWHATVNKICTSAHRVTKCFTKYGGTINMKKWEVTYPIGGTFDFSGDFEVAEVAFSINATNKKYEAKIIIEDENKNDAIKKAQEIIENVLDVISFVREVGFDIGLPSVFQKDSKEMLQITRSELIPITTKVHKRIINNVYENLEPMFKNKEALSNEQKRALLTLRWYRHGCFFSNPSDKFLAFWIAVESLAGEKEKSKRDLPFDVKDCIECVKDKVGNVNMMSQVVQSIHNAYRPISDVITENIKNILNIVDVNKIEGIKAKIKKIKDDRSALVHGGNVQIDVVAHSEYLQQLIEKLLREELDVAFDHFIDSWPTAKQREKLSDDYLEIEAIKCVLSKYPEGATIDEMEYGLFSLTKRIRRPKDLHAKLEVLSRNGDGIRADNKGRYFRILG